MNKRVMKHFTWLFALIFIFHSLAMPHAAEAKEDLTQPAIIYTALGDSLAAGMNEQGEIGKGYADFIAAYLQKNQQLQSYNKGFAYPGYTTDDVLNDLETNREKPIVGLNTAEESIQIQSALQQSNLITMSVGANDLLHTLKELNVDVSKGVAPEALPGIMASIEQLAKKNRLIVEKITAQNPTAKLYVMGIYNPFPHANEQAQAQILPLLAYLNGAIEKSLVGSQAIFVPVQEEIAKDYATYVPNPLNIHLSEAGYQVVAKQFLTYMFPTPIAFTDVAGHWAQQDIERAAAAGLIKGYPDQTFRPEQNLTRAQVAAILVRALQIKATQPAPFTDLSKYPVETITEISAAYENGLIKGINGKFNPGESVTRVQLALMIYRSFELVEGVPYPGTKQHPFTDLGAYDQETQKAVSMMYELEIAQGYGDAFKPGQTTTRAQAAKMIGLALTNMQRNP